MSNSILLWAIPVIIIIGIGIWLVRSKKWKLSKINIKTAVVDVELEPNTEEPNSKNLIQKKRPVTKKQMTGVDFGEDNDFTDATIKNISGRDAITRIESKQNKDGQALGIKLGKRNRYKDAKIKNVTGRDHLGE
ncbi:MAG: hypothetical protein HYZ24_14835 [Chloroflexi bacterium]|nr:hypothetical protein [Chloroflexota bacterium]